MKLADATHTEQPWRIHEITRDFELAGVWSFDAPGAGPDDFAKVVDALEAAGAPTRQPALVRFLFAVRWRLGALFGWDKPANVPSLRDQLPPDIEPNHRETGALLAPVYDLDNECARELANKTVHGVLHLGWLPNASGDHELRMTVLVKPNGVLGRLYMAAIAPFRHLIVYPAMERQWARAWREVRGTVGTTAVPATVQARSSLSRIDYVDLFTLDTDVTATPEQWARAMFGDVPDAGEILIWRGLLGLRITRTKSPDTVAGWRIAERGADWLRLETQSWFLTANLVVRAADGQVSLATFLRYDRKLGNLVWPALSAVHRRLTPGVLRDAVAKLRVTRSDA